jgi:RNA polymerase sigma-70 factor (ECF subfamily)
MIDEVKQRLLELLFVRAGISPPAIVGYSGRGALLSWLRSIAVRTAVPLLRASRRDAPVGAVVDLPAAGDVELAYLKARYREPFRAALEESFGALTRRQRNLLRQHFLDGLGIDELGALHQVHRATAARWLAEARETLLRETRRQLAERLALEPDDLDGILQAVMSQLHVTLRRVLR